MNEFVFRYLYDLAFFHSWLKPLVIFAAVYLGWLLVFLVLVRFARRARVDETARSELIFAVSTASAAWLVAQMIKWFWPVARPFVTLEDITPLIDVGVSAAFPSGHAVFFFALALAVYALDKKFGRWLMVGAALVSLARIIAGVHWPLDILAGLAVAIFAVSAALFLARLRSPGFGRRERT